MKELRREIMQSLNVLPVIVVALIGTGCSVTDDRSDASVVLEVISQDVVITAKHVQELAVRVSYPRGGAASYPLIVFSHGNSLSNDTYDALLNNWVRKGYVVAAPRHLDSGSRDYVNELIGRVGRDWVSASRVLDLSVVIDQIESITLGFSDFSGTVRTDRVIAAGHSSGALTAQLAAGATLERSGKSVYSLPAQLRDSRIVAAVALSSPGEIPGVLTAATWRNLDAPQLVITGTKDVFEFLWPQHSDHFIAYETARPGQNYLLVIDGMDHYLGNLIGRLDREALSQPIALEIVTAATLEFMHAYLTADDSAVAVAVMADYIESSQRLEIIRFDHR